MKLEHGLSIQDQIATTLNNDLENVNNWIILVSNRTGNSTVNLPGSFSELFIKVNISNLDIILTGVIPYNILYSSSEKAQSYRIGYYQTSSNGSGAIFTVNKSYFQFLNAFLNQSDVTSITTWSIWYKK